MKHGVITRALPLSRRWLPFVSVFRGGSTPTTSCKLRNSIRETPSISPEGGLLSGTRMNSLVTYPPSLIIAQQGQLMRAQEGISTM